MNRHLVEIWRVINPRGKEMNEDSLRAFIDSHSWTFAKTYTETAPHEYLNRKILPDDDKRVFDEAVIFIRKNGFRGTFQGREYVYFRLGDWKYWTMGDPLQDTFILNRVRIR